MREPKEIVRGLHPDPATLTVNNPLISDPAYEGGRMVSLLHYFHVMEFNRTLKPPWPTPIRLYQCRTCKLVFTSPQDAAAVQCVVEVF